MTDYDCFAGAAKLAGVLDRECDHLRRELAEARAAHAESERIIDALCRLIAAPIAPDTIPSLTVINRTWLVADQPELECELCDGSWVKIAWDSDYSHRLLYVAPDKSADYATATADQTGLSEDILAPLVDEVESAVRHHIAEERSEYMGDAMSFEDGR